MNWPHVSLHDVTLKIRNGLNIKQSSDNNGLPITRIETISDQTINFNRVGYAGLKKGEKKEWYLKKGEILFSHINSEERIGNCAIYNGSPDPLVHGMNLLCLSPNPSLIESKFLFNALRNPIFKKSLKPIIKRAVNQASVSIGNLEQLKIPLPSPTEQHKIVEILDQADRLRQLRAEADKKAERILPALFIKMFGDPASNPMGWETGILDDVIIETQYGTSTKANTDGKGVPLIRMNNVDIVGNLDLSDIKYVELSEKEKKKLLLSKGDIIFNRTNSKELVGKTGIWSGHINAVMASYLIRVRTNPEKVVPEFIWASMNMPFMKQILLNKSRRAIGMANINAKELRSFPIFIPAKRVQQKFSAKLHHVNEIKSGRKISGEKLEKLFTVLLHRAFTGDLTASWRQAHMKELLQEMEIQARALAG